MYRYLGKDSNVEINANKATELLALNTYKSQRGIRQKHVDDLADRMRRGLYLTGKIIIAYLPDNNKILIDGQHTLSAVVQSGCIIKADIETVFCPKGEDLSLLFQQPDGGVVRSISDMLKVEANSLNLKWKHRVCELVVGGAAILENMTRATKREKVPLLKECLTEGAFINSILENRADHGHLYRVPVVAAMMQTYRVDSVEAKTFWTQVSNGEMIKKNWGAWHLRAFLTTILSTRGTNSKKQHRTVSDYEIQWRCIYAWNLFRAGKTTKVFKFSSDWPMPKAA